MAGLAAIPYLLFTDVNYIDKPYGSGNFLNESAFCALLDTNIYPKVIHQFINYLLEIPIELIYLCHLSPLQFFDWHFPFLAPYDIKP